MKLNRQLNFLLLLDKPGDAGGGGGADDVDELAQDLADLGDDPPADDAEEEDADDDSDDSDDTSDNAPDDADDDAPADGDEQEEEEEEQPPVDDKKKKKEGEEEEERQADGRPTVRAIKTFGDGKYKDLFKDFPDLKRAYFQVSKYQEVFPTPEAATDAAGKAEEFDNLESELIAGNAELLLKTLDTNAPKSLAKVVEGFAETLKKVNSDVYTKLTTPIIEELLYFASKHADKTGNKNLGLAAKHIANFVFNNGGEIVDVSKRTKAEKSEAEVALDKEREQFATERHGAAVAQVGDAASKSLDSIITAKFPADLSGYTKKTLLRDIREEVNTTLANDKVFMNNLKAMWGSARKANYDTASKERIKQAWLSRARQVVPAIRQRLLKEATGKAPTSGPQNEQQRKRTFPQSGGRAPVAGRGVLDPRKIDYGKTTDADILSGDNGRVTLRK